MARAAPVRVLPVIAHPNADDPPDWVQRHGLQGQCFTVRQQFPRNIDGSKIERLTAEAYERLFESVGAPGGRHLIRIWNFVPNLLADAGGGLNRYMRFNVGRHQAFARRLGPESGFGENLPAASAVGTEGDEFVIHALTSQAAGKAVHNPRQRPPHRYSMRFGPRPPCFARARLAETGELGRALVVGGTASVVGEESAHVGRLDLQLAETIENLAAVEREAFGASETERLHRYVDLRVYHPRPEDGPEIQATLVNRFRNLRRIEFIIADLCRPELLVEIEALALPVTWASGPCRAV